MMESKKLSSVDIKNGKLTTAIDGQIAYGESRISDDHFKKCVAKCKDEKSMIAAMKLKDERTKVKEK